MCWPRERWFRVECVVNDENEAKVPSLTRYSPNGSQHASANRMIFEFFECCVSFRRSGCDDFFFRHSFSHSPHSLSVILIRGQQNWRIIYILLFFFVPFDLAGVSLSSISVGHSFWHITFWVLASWMAIAEKQHQWHPSWGQKTKHIFTGPILRSAWQTKRKTH